MRDMPPIYTYTLHIHLTYTRSERWSMEEVSGGSATSESGHATHWQVDKSQSPTHALTTSTQSNSSDLRGAVLQSCNGNLV